MKASFDKAEKNTGSLGEYLRYSEHLLANTVDEEYGESIGLRILEGVKNLGCKDIPADKYQLCDAAYCGFTWLKDLWGSDGKLHDYKAGDDIGSQPTFINTISYQHKGCSKDLFVLSRIHECVHGMAWGTSPVLNATPFNMKAVVMLSPLDWIIATEVTERHAYAIQGWNASLLAGKSTVIAKETLSPVNAADFLQLRKKYRDLQSTLDAAGELAMRKLVKADKNGVVRTFRDHYHLHALEDYECMIKNFKKAGVEPFFVRMETEDLATITSFLGPAASLSTNLLEEGVKLSDENKKILAEIDRILGTSDHDNIPRFQDRLAVRGLSPENFMRFSQCNGSISLHELQKPFIHDQALALIPNLTTIFPSSETRQSQSHPLPGLPFSAPQPPRDLPALTA